jgi:hypothetical protein
VYVSFNSSETIYVDENQQVTNVCLELRNVSQPTEDEIWVNVATVEGSAMGECMGWGL